MTNRGLYRGAGRLSQRTTLGLLGVLPVPTAADAGKGIRVRSDLSGYEFDARDVAAGLPVYAPFALSRWYNPDQNTYGLTANLMAPQRIAMAKALADLGTFNWLHCGDSLSAGYFGLTSAKPNDPSSSWVYVARDALLASGVNWGGTGYVSANQNMDPAEVGDDYDPRWVLSAGWDTKRYGLYAQAITAGETATFTAERAGGTDITFVIDDRSANMTYVVKNTAGATLTSGAIASANTNTIRLLHIGSLVDVRSVTFTTPAGTANTLGNRGLLMPVNIYRATGMQVHNLAFVGAYGTGSLGWENTGGTYNGADKVALLCVPTPDLLTVLLGGNDRLGAYTSAVITAGLTAVFAKWGANAGTKIFIGHSQAGSWSNVNMNIWTGDYWAMCEAAGIGFVDQYAFTQGYTLMNAMGVMQDGGSTTHPNQAYAQLFGKHQARIMFIEPGMEGLQDSVAQLLVAGSNVTLTYDDVNGKLTVASSGGAGGGMSTFPAWVGNTVYTAGQYATLPTGGVAYRTAAGTSAATFTAAERDAWTFLPGGGHYEKLTSGTTTWKCPPGIASAQFMLTGSGGSGGGAASAATAIVQAGAGGGGAADPLRFQSAVTAGTSYTTSIGASKAGGAGGIAAGNLGTAGTSGDDTTIVIGGTTYTSKGGGAGNRSLVGVNTAANGGMYGFPGGTVASGSYYPGGGGVSGAVPTGAVPLAGMVGGAGGVSATTTLGGNGGGARTAPGAQVPTPSGNTGTTSGGAGTTATQPGCGGGGGGGATGTTGVGGTGGASGAGIIEVWF